MKIISHSLEETEKIAQDFLNTLTPNEEGSTIVYLQGDLGSGKTTFTQAVGKILQADSNITSPTFVIEKFYKITHPYFDELVHIDAYRLSGGAELLMIGWADMVKNPRRIVFLEWPELVPDLATGKEKKINFKFLNETEREIEL
ncbi:MAG: tRNA (adenosine(37)-N6)-threonylcarbamoyltransferase complex ATPase subunit type 1 TsaE [bacterium]